MINKEDFINRIARKIVGFKNDVIHALDNNKEIELQIEEIEIIIDYYGDIENDYNNIITASVPVYKLTEIKNLMNCKIYTTLKKLENRQDGRDDWKNIGLTTEQAKDVIRNLKESEYICSHKRRKPYLDEYHHPYNLPEGISQEYIKRRGNSTSLYIKLGVMNHKFVIIESFHWNEYEEN